MKSGVLRFQRDIRLAGEVARHGTLHRQRRSARGLELGTLSEMREPSLPCTPKPLTTRLPWPIAYTSPSIPRSGVINKLPPRRLLRIARWSPP